MTANSFDLVADLRREVVVRGVNQYRQADPASRLASHLALHEGTGHPLFVGESPATRSQGVAFTDTSKSSLVFNRTLGDFRVARWNAWPFWQPVKPNAKELRRGAEYARQVADLVGSMRIYAVGRLAEKCLAYAGLGCEYLPHPAQDKAPLFVKRVDEIVGRNQ